MNLSGVGIGRIGGLILQKQFDRARNKIRQEISSFRITFSKMEISMISVRMQNQPILFEKLAQYSCKKSVKISGEKSGNSYFLTLLSTFTGGGY